MDENPAREHAKVVESLKKITDKLLEEPVETSWTQSTIRKMDNTMSSKDAPEVKKSRWTKAKTLMGQFRNSKEVSS